MYMHVCTDDGKPSYINTARVVYAAVADLLALPAVLVVLLLGLTLAGVRLSVLKGGSNKVLAAAQRGGLLFTHKVRGCT
jgi:hypothetical protein